MHIYLPIAELSANWLGLVLLGSMAGVFSGMFGIGGGFILTPMLIFMGVPSAVAVATSANMIIASSFSGFLSHWEKKRVDIEIGNWLIGGGLVGVMIGVWIFTILKQVGQIDLMISLLYISLLGTIGVLMGLESWKMVKANRLGETIEHGIVPMPMPKWVKKLRWQKKFSRSDVQHSVAVPVVLGLISGILVSLLGVGGGFIMVPAMLYILRMPSNVIIGTSLYQIIFITAAATLMHAITTHSVDIVLALLLLAGSAIGAQWGVRWSNMLPSYIMRGMLAAMLLIVVLRLAYGLFVTPPEIFTLTVDL